MNVTEEWEKIGEVKETRSLKVAIRGTGSYLFLPKSFVELYGIMAGDKIKVKMMDIFRPKKYVEGESSG